MLRRSSPDITSVIGMHTTTPPASLAIGMVLFPGLTQLDLTGAYEVLARMPEQDFNEQRLAAAFQRFGMPERLD